MAARDVAPVESEVLLRFVPGIDDVHVEVGIAREHPPETAVGPESANHDAQRDAGVAALAIRQKERAARAPEPLPGQARVHVGLMSSSESTTMACAMRSGK